MDQNILKDRSRTGTTALKTDWNSIKTGDQDSQIHRNTTELKNQIEINLRATADEYRPKKQKEKDLLQLNVQQTRLNADL